MSTCAEGPLYSLLANAEVKGVAPLLSDTFCGPLACTMTITTSPVDNPAGFVTEGAVPVPPLVALLTKLIMVYSIPISRV